ncbi:beta strand repeat-containing protein [Spirosoma sp. KUDC1026]|uniref:beta strand repeat-containing protein n=1 Tax=Spirosoma sp. KUDC1026 TaxID=2745947 RepID=UPI00159BBB9F|nr:putative Ig domain-containing protein [Spirosoma sp. KUDC1026]QKZ12531.1 putative Ig domain-containing protein [Spirosoma sp. KUDC1026]
MTLSLPYFTRSLVRVFWLLVLLSGASLLTQAQAQTIRYVKPTATGTGSGNSWINASGNLQAMINASSSGQQVWVAAGTYKPGGNDNADRTISFAMKNGVSMYGGFVGNETALSARPAINPTTPSTTILSGDIGEVGYPDDNSFHVILNRLGVTNITVLDGFVVTGGNANEPGPPQEPRNIGGGMCNVGQSSFANPSSGPPSSPQISNCLFTANSAASGGAIYNGAGSSGVSSPALTNCVFQANTASNGGAIYNVGGSGSAIQPKLTACLFQANSATTSGGAIYNYGFFGRTSNPELTNCSFQDNRAAAGGAIYNDGKSDGGNSSPTLTNCSFKSNRADSRGAIDNDGYFDANNSGGAIVNDGDFDGNSSPLIRNCSFQSNSAVSGGGAIFNLTGRVRGDNLSNPKLTNCLFQSNTASSGGAIYNFTRYEGEINLVLTNCTFRANTATNAGGVLYGYGYGNGAVSTSTLTNCILVGNGGNRTFYNEFTTISATYNLFDASVTGYSGSMGNRTATVSPFASASDPALFACSPAVNAGLNSATGLVGVTTDLAGNPRIFGDLVDMGAYEYQSAGGLTITAPSVSTATLGVAFSQSFVASGGSSPYSYSLASGSLPTGLGLAADGTLSGTPTQLGSFSITVKATNVAGCSGVSVPYVLRVVSATPIRYVRAGASGSGNSWADASGDLQRQINFTGAEQVWVANGTYKPGSAGSTDRSISFSMKNGVPIYGGFAGNETALSQRVLTNPLATILSGDIGTPGNSADNSYHVVSNPPGLTNSAVLDGFVITSGNANGSSAPNDGGGGMLNNGNGAGNTCSPLIRNCLFQNNNAANQGGALHNAGYTSGTSSPSLINCAFQNNNATNQGGAIYNDGSVGGTSNTRLTNCSFQANSASSGGAMSSVGYQGTSGPVLTNCVVWGNGGASTFTNGPGAFITTSYSLFETSVTGYNPGTGNLTTTVSPFLSATDTRLNGCTPALNSGDNAAYSAANGPATDLAGNARVFPNGGRIDMGAYELQTTAGLSVSVPGVNKAILSLAFSQPFTVTGGTSPYSYSLASGSLPTGLSLASTGVVSGTPTQVGSFTITVKATDATGCSGVSAPYVLTVDPGSPIRYVRAGASGSGNSWADASGNLQSQINFAGAQQVWVAAGTYKPTTGTDRTISFSMKNGVAVYGGFAGTETSLSQRPAINPVGGNPSSTTLSGNIGNAGSSTDNTYHVFSHPREVALNSTAVLDGFVIRDGYDNDQTPSGFYGGGMYNDNSSPTIANCSFLDNTSFLGGGMYNNGTSNPGLTNCSFRSNTAINTGGGMENNGTSNPMLTNCSFVGNRARFGGGMGNDYSSSPTLTNCSFVSNTASDTGGGMFNGNSNPVLINCSFLSNSSVNSGGGIYNQDSNPTLTNCVLFGNGGAKTFSSRTGFSVTYSLLEPAVTGYTSSPTNLITTVSPFVSATDASLNGCSPAINSGLNSANTTSIDLAGNPRIYQNSRIDMGAYEYQAAPTSITTTAPGVSTATVGVAFSQTFTASGGSGPYSYSVASGSLPTGLNLVSTGTLSGTPTQSGSFTITVLGRDATGCSGVSAPYVLTVTDAASTSPTLSGLNASPAAVCVGTVATFTATVGNLSGSYSYTLTNGSNRLTGTSTSSTFSQSVTAAGTGSQTFTLTISANGQSASSATALTVNSLPVAGLTNDGPLSCTKTSVTLTATGAGTYQFSAGATSVNGGPTASVTTAGIYSVTVTNSNGCTSVASTTVVGDASVPVAGLTNDGPLSCAKTSVLLTASGGETYQFSPGATPIAGGPTASVTTAGVYSVTVVGTNGCTSVASTTVVGDASGLTARLIAPDSFCSGKVLELGVALMGTAPFSYTWTSTNGSGDSFFCADSPSYPGNCATPNVNFSTTTRYNVVVTDANGCTATAAKTVNVVTTPTAPVLLGSPALTSLPGGIPFRLPPVARCPCRPWWRAIRRGLTPGV